MLDAVLIDMPTSRPETYAFSVPLTSIYSLLVHAPSLSSWCELLMSLLWNALTSIILRWFHCGESNQRVHVAYASLS